MENTKHRIEILQAKVDMAMALYEFGNRTIHFHSKYSKNRIERNWKERFNLQGEYETLSPFVEISFELTEIKGSSRKILYASARIEFFDKYENVIREEFYPINQGNEEKSEETIYIPFGIVAKDQSNQELFDILPETYQTAFIRYDLRRLYGKQNANKRSLIFSFAVKDKTENFQPAYHVAFFEKETYLFSLDRLAAGIDLPSDLQYLNDFRMTFEKPQTFFVFSDKPPLMQLW